MSKESLITSRMISGLWLLATLTAPASAQIYNWQTGQVIPGTESITPGPGLTFIEWNTETHNLRYADLSGGLDLTGAQFRGVWMDSARLTGAHLNHAWFQGSWLTSADLSGSHLADSFFMFGWLTNANLSGADLSNARFYKSSLADANLSGAIVVGAVFRDGTRLTPEQLCSTASYQARDLQGIGLSYHDLTGCNLAGQNLTNASLAHCRLSEADLSGANLINANLFFATLTNANLSQAVIRGADLSRDLLSDNPGITISQLYSTASYQCRDLRGVRLTANNLTGCNLTGQNLTGASLTGARLTNADFTGAVVAGANLYSTTDRGFTKEQLYSTASYQAGDLHGISLEDNDLTGWNLAGQNLADAILLPSVWTDADLSRADMRGALCVEFSSEMTLNAIRPDGTIRGLNLAARETLPIRDYDGGIPITIDNGMTLDEGSVLEFLFEDATWGSTITLAGGFTPDLGGTLMLGLAKGADASALLGTTFDLFNWNSQLLPGDTFDLISTLPGWTWDTSSLYTSGEVTLIGIPEPATLAFLSLGGLFVSRRRRSSQTQ